MTEKKVTIYCDWSVSQLDNAIDHINKALSQGGSQMTPRRSGLFGALNFIKAVREQIQKPKDMDDPKRDTHLVTDDGPVVPMILAGYATATISANGALLKLELLNQQDQSLVVLPVGMTRAQCTELGDSLKRLAVLPYRPDQQMN